MKIYASEGEIVTCTNGHHVCKFTETVFYYAVQELERQLSFLPGQVKPSHGSSFDKCTCYCGSSYTKAYNGGQIFHFKDGWRAESIRTNMDSLLYKMKFKLKNLTKESLFLVIGVLSVSVSILVSALLLWLSDNQYWDVLNYM